MARARDQGAAAARGGPVFQKPTITSTAAKGIANACEFQKDLVGKLLTKAKPGFFGAAQADELWSVSEQRHLRSGHFWLFEFGHAYRSKGAALVA